MKGSVGKDGCSESSCRGYDVDKSLLPRILASQEKNSIRLTDLDHLALGVDSRK